MLHFFLIDCFNQSKAILEDAISRHCLDSDESAQNNPSDYRILKQFFYQQYVCVSNFKSTTKPLGNRTLIECNFRAFCQRYRTFGLYFQDPYIPTLTCKFTPTLSFLGPKIEMLHISLIDCFNRSKAIQENSISRHCLDSDESYQNNPSDYRILKQVFFTNSMCEFQNLKVRKNIWGIGHLLSAI